MKKIFCLIILGVGLALSINKAKAAPAGYEIRFESESCDVPIGGNVYSYLPEAYVYDTYNDRIVSTSMIYYYDFQGIKIDDIDVYQSGRSVAYVSAVSREYSDLTILQRIYVNVIDDEAPVVFINGNISISYEESFNLNNYLSYHDNATSDICTVDLEGEYMDKRVGKYNLSVTVTDGANNATQRNFILNIYDNKKPNIICDDIMDVNIGVDFNINDYIKAIDEYDGEISFSVTDYDLTKLGKNNITITATDSSYNTITKNACINVVDNLKPNITLKDMELSVVEDYDLKNNILSVTDNYDNLNISDIIINKKRIGTQQFLVTYTIYDISGNKEVKECIVNYSYINKPVITPTNLDDLKDIFDPFDYVLAYDVEDGDITNKIVLVELNYIEKYGIYEVYDSDNNLTRTKINYVTDEDLEKYENKTNLTFPKDEIDSQSPISSDETVKSVSTIEKKNYNFIYYIVLGVFALGILIYILVKHFRKKMV